MSVFIHIKEAEIDQTLGADQIGLKISSRDTELTVDPVLAFPSALFGCSLISSIKQQHLQFTLTLLQLNNDDVRTLTTELSFSPLHCSPEKESSQSISFDGHAKLQVDIFFTKKKNFLGPIEFYEYQNVSTSSIIIHKEQQKKQTEVEQQIELKKTAPMVRPPLPDRTNITFQYGKPVEKPVSSGGLFFCCGQNIEEHKYEVEDFEERPGETTKAMTGETTFPNQLQNEPKKVEFYQGACQSKNMFSICDVPVNDNKFTIVEDYYRDKET